MEMFSAAGLFFLAGQKLGRLEKPGPMVNPVRPTHPRGRSKMLRRLCGILLTLVILCVVAGFVLRGYLTSRGVADKVVAQLQTVCKGKIVLGGIDVGLKGTSLTKLEYFDVDSPDKTPCIEIAELQTDFSVLDYIQGNSLSGKVKITGAKIVLRFAKDGTLLTALPEPLTRAAWENAEDSGRFESVPQIEFEKSQIILRADGWPDLVIRDISGKLERVLDQLSLSAAADGDSWGAWAIVGLCHKHSAKISLQFASQGGVHVTRGMLERLPLVPAACWQQVSVERLDTPMLLHLDYDLKQGECHFRAEFQPSGADIRLHGPKLSLSRAQARVVLEDNLIQVREFRGDVQGGSVRGGADVVVEPGQIRIDSRIEARQCDVSRLPSNWGLPQHGKLTGAASLKVVITPPDLSATGATRLAALLCDPLGPVEIAAALLAMPLEPTIRTEGSGRGQITDAVSGPLHIDTIELELHAVPGGFRFGSVR